MRWRDRAAGEARAYGGAAGRAKLGGLRSLWPRADWRWNASPLAATLGARAACVCRRGGGNAHNRSPRRPRRERCADAQPRSKLRAPAFRTRLRAVLASDLGPLQGVPVLFKGGPARHRCPTPRFRWLGNGVWREHFVLMAPAAPVARDAGAAHAWTQARVPRGGPRGWSRRYGRSCMSKLGLTLSAPGWRRRGGPVPGKG